LVGEGNSEPFSFLSRARQGMFMYQIWQPGYLGENWVNTGDLFSLSLLIGGAITWAMVLIFYLFDRPCLSLDPPPRSERVEVQLEHVLAVILVILVSYAPLGGKTTGQTGGAICQLVATTGALALMLVLVCLYGAIGNIFDNTGIRSNRAVENRSAWVKVLIHSFVAFLAAYALVETLTGLSSLVYQTLHQPLPEPHPTLQTLASPNLTWPVRIIILVSAAVAFPAAEELFFRGFVQNYLLKLTRRPVLAIGITATFFMLAHPPIYHQFAGLFALGVVFGWSYYRYRTIWVPVLTHVIFNSTSLLLYYLGGQIHS
jgi:membrane protease YdiL (CAAX protease family)